MTTLTTTLMHHTVFLTIPCFLLMLSLRNGQPFYRKETVLMILIGSAGECLLSTISEQFADL